MGVVGIFANSFIYRALIELCSFQFPEALTVYFLLVLGTIYLGWLALDYAAGSIAPISENRTTPRRLICLGIVGVLGIVIMMADRNFQEFAPVFMLILSAPIGIISLTEHPYTTATVSVPFVRKGMFGKISSYFFYPGWASGLNFVMLLFALTLLSSLFFIPSHSYGFGSNFSQEVVTVACICFSCLVFPLLLARIFFRNTLQLFVFYLGGLVAAGVLWLLVVIIAEETRSRGIYSAFFWLPPVQFNIFERYATRDIIHAIALPTFLIYWVACFATTSKFWKHIRSNDLQAEGIIAEEQNLTESK
jgi:hypothetical protein